MSPTPWAGSRSSSVFSARWRGLRAERPLQLEAERLEQLDSEPCVFEQPPEARARVRRRRRLDHAAASAQPQQSHDRAAWGVQDPRDDVPLVVGRDHERSTRAQHARQLPHGCRRVEHVLDHLRAEHEVELAVRERKRFEIRLPELSRGLLPRRLEDPLRDVDAGAPRRELVRECSQIAPVAAARVEKRLRGQPGPNELADPRELAVEPGIRQRRRRRILLRSPLLVELAQAVGGQAHGAKATAGVVRSRA